MKIFHYVTWSEVGLGGGGGGGGIRIEWVQKIFLGEEPPTTTGILWPRYQLGARDGIH